FNRKTLRDVFIGSNISSVEIQDSHIYYEAHNNIHRYPAKHNYKPLPRWFASEFPRLWRPGHLLFVHALVYHSGNFYVAAQWQPADSVNGFANFLFEE